MAFCISTRCNLCWRRFTANDVIQAINDRGDEISDMTFSPAEWQFYMNTHTFKACVGYCTHIGPSLGFHSTCYNKVHTHSKKLWHRYKLVSEALQDFEPSISQDKRRMEWYKECVDDDVALACGRLPQELRDIISEYVAYDQEHMIGASMARWNKAVEECKNEDFGDVAGWKGLMVTYTMYEGVRYLESISNRKDKNSTRQVAIKPTSGPVDTVYVSHDHLGVRDVATCNGKGKQPIVEEEPGVWWQTIPIEPGSCNLLWKRDAKKIRLLVKPAQAEQNRKNRLPPLWYTRLPTAEKLRFHRLESIDKELPCRLSPFRLSSPGLTGYSFMWCDGLITMITHSSNPKDARLYNVPKRDWRSVWVYIPMEEGDHITNVWVRKSFSKSNSLVFRTKMGRTHRIGPSPEEGWGAGLYVTWAAGLTPEDNLLFDDNPKKVQAIAVSSKIAKNIQSEPPLELYEPVSRRPRWDIHDAFWSIASLENVVACRLNYDHIGHIRRLTGIVFDYSDGHSEVVGQVRPELLCETLEITDSVQSIWLFSVDYTYLRASLSLTSMPKETSMEIPLRGQLEWWWAVNASFAHHNDTGHLSMAVPIRTFVETEY